MSFSKSSENPRLVQGRFLAAMCPADIGFRKISMLDLAGYIGNDDGMLPILGFGAIRLTDK